VTSIIANGNERFQYASDDYLIGEVFVDAQVADAGMAVVLEHVHGFSTSTEVRWLQIFEVNNGDGLLPPANGTIPLVSIRIEAEAEFSWMAPMGGFRITGHLFVGSWWVSETGNEYTQSADTFWVNAQGRISQRPG